MRKEDKREGCFRIYRKKMIQERENNRQLPMELGCQVIGGGEVGCCVWQKECLWEILLVALTGT